MKLQRFSLGLLGTNCYVLSADNKEALIFDPGGEPEKIIHYVREEKLNPLAILLTHAHFDHIGAVDELRSHYDIPVYLHEAEKDWLTTPELNRSILSLPEAIITEEPDYLLETGELKIGSFKMEVIHTPGHSPGSSTFIFNSHQFIISGDVLFQHGVGRTDLPGGDFQTLKNSIQEKLYKLADEFQVFSGHGDQTTIGFEKEHNPFISS